MATAQAARTLNELRRDARVRPVTVCGRYVLHHAKHTMLVVNNDVSAETRQSTIVSSLARSYRSRLGTLPLFSRVCSKWRCAVLSGHRRRSAGTAPDNFLIAVARDDLECLIDFDQLRSFQFAQHRRCRRQTKGVFETLLALLDHRGHSRSFQESPD
jgi:hypothetical protein